MQNFAADREIPMGPGENSLRYFVFYCTVWIAKAELHAGAEPGYGSLCPQMYLNVR
jgi:hypothetical protein